MLSLRPLFFVILGIAALSGGCERKAYKDGPTVDAFVGRLTHKGEPVTFPADDKVLLKVILQTNGRSFGIPIQSDGTFQIGWMPIGKYSAILSRRSQAAGNRRGPQMYNVPDGFTIEEGKTEYNIELGPNWKQ